MTATTAPEITEAQVLEWTEQLCEALAENYKRWHYRGMTKDPSFANTDYGKKQVKAMDEGTANLMKFRIQPGQKYLKIIQVEFDTFQDRNEWRDGSVHAFVNKKTGRVYKPASWRGPAKHPRYNLSDQKSREFVLNPDNCDWAGGYLYMR
jgi:hypothetical protein